AYVNPVVAVFLGWLIVGESFTTQTIIAAIIILTGVVLILTDKKGELQTQTTTRLVAEPDTVCEMETIPISIEKKR
ncbi:MAG: EamA family transporter, partial [Ignavibacteriales bacterium]|nr:EamA family transporter [Ignavibacteriales bacterium]